MSRAADGSNKTRTYGPVLNGWILGSQGLSGLEQDRFSSLSGVKREWGKVKLGYGFELVPSGKVFWKCHFSSAG